MANLFDRFIPNTPREARNMAGRLVNKATDLTAPKEEDVALAGGPEAAPALAPDTLVKNDRVIASDYNTDQVLATARADGSTTPGYKTMSATDMTTLLEAAKKDDTKLQIGFVDGTEGIFEIGTKDGLSGKFGMTLETLALTTKYPDQVAYSDPETAALASSAEKYTVRFAEAQAERDAAKAKAEAEHDAGTAGPATAAAAIDVASATADAAMGTDAAPKHAAPAQPTAQPLEGRNAEISALAKDSNTVLNSLDNKDVQAAMADLDGKAGFTIDDVYAFQKLGKADAEKVTAIAGILSKSGTTAPESETEKPSAEPLAPSASPVQRPGQGVGLIER